MGQLKVGFNLRGNRAKEKITIRPRLDVPASLAPSVRTSFAGGPGGAALPFIGSARASYRVGFHRRGNRVKEKIKIRPRLDVLASFAPSVRTSFTSDPGGISLPFQHLSFYSLCYAPFYAMRESIPDAFSPPCGDGGAMSETARHFGERAIKTLLPGARNYRF